jgi:translation initiation factor 5A
MDTDGNSKDDVKVPDTDLGKEIETAFEDGKDCMVTIIAAMGGFIYCPKSVKELKLTI